MLRNETSTTIESLHRSGEVGSNAQADDEDVLWMGHGTNRISAMTTAHTTATVRLLLICFLLRMSPPLTSGMSRPTAPAAVEETQKSHATETEAHREPFPATDPQATA
jgi:hypothetical protein